ncbi:hypothetical protein QF023_001678 [Chryseobacterium sp. SLBN-27]|uniref:DUF3892 domain-containing protein n=1 Tax=Chryseobacterium sp. SLBN-27 TaxID=3042287 RepID=UPI00285EFA44|nr:DUF3892 domain-containing protein [Chryseobacterium sp. SLBN-27]MDR6158162.1 hypothetical protein [Chryseobacterium sp. SLBN-27]
MEKWADYLISHVERDSNGNVLRVLLHIDNGDTVLKGYVKTKDEVIDLLKKGFTVETTIWGYPKWQRGAIVHYVRVGSYEYLRTNRNKTDKDNLDNLMLLY